MWPRLWLSAASSSGPSAFAPVGLHHRDLGGVGVRPRTHPSQRHPTHFRGPWRPAVTSGSSRRRDEGPGRQLTPEPPTCSGSEGTVCGWVYRPRLLSRVFARLLTWKHRPPGGCSGHIPRPRVGECARGRMCPLTGTWTHGLVAQLYQSVGVKAGGGWPVAGQGLSRPRCLKSCAVKRGRCGGDRCGT